MEVLVFRKMMLLSSLLKTWYENGGQVELWYDNYRSCLALVLHSGNPELPNGSAETCCCRVKNMQKT